MSPKNAVLGAQKVPQSRVDLKTLWQPSSSWGRWRSHRHLWHLCGKGQAGCPAFHPSMPLKTQHPLLSPQQEGLCTLSGACHWSWRCKLAVTEEILSFPEVRNVVSTLN